MRGYVLRAAERAASVAGLVTAVIVLMAGFALIGVGVAGAGGAVAGIAVATALTVGGYAWGARLALAAMGARPVSEVEQPELYLLVRGLTTAGRQPVPRLYVSPAEQPNCFTVGRSPRTATVCCTAGLLRALDEAGLRGVLAHELAHVSGHDILTGSMFAGLATALTSPAALARFARPGRGERGADSGPSAVASGSELSAVASGSGLSAVASGSGLSAVASGSGLGAVEAALMLVLGPAAALLIRLATSPEREYRADATGALLTGDPVALARALRTIEAAAADYTLPPDGRRVSVGHLMIAYPFRATGVARLFLTHPPPAERVRRLEALAGYRR